jgi:hypothetical protein
MGDSKLAKSNLVPVAILTYGEPWKDFVRARVYDSNLSNRVATNIKKLLAAKLGDDRVGFMQDSSYDRTVVAVFGQAGWPQACTSGCESVITTMCATQDRSEGCLTEGMCHQGVHRAHTWGKQQEVMFNYIELDGVHRVFNAQHFAIIPDTPKGEAEATIASAISWTRKPWQVIDAPFELFGKAAVSKRASASENFTEISVWLDDLVSCKATAEGLYGLVGIEFDRPDDSPYDHIQGADSVEYVDDVVADEPAVLPRVSPYRCNVKTGPRVVAPPPRKAPRQPRFPPPPHVPPPPPAKRARPSTKEMFESGEVAEGMHKESPCVYFSNPKTTTTKCIPKPFLL